jgi:hypothetical protein
MRTDYKCRRCARPYQLIDFINGSLRAGRPGKADAFPEHLDQFGPMDAVPVRALGTGFQIALCPRGRGSLDKDLRAAHASVSFENADNIAFFKKHRTSPIGPPIYVITKSRAARTAKGTVIFADFLCRHRCGKSASKSSDLRCVSTPEISGMVPPLKDRHPAGS